MNSRRRVDKLQKEWKRLEQSGPSRPVAIAVQDRSETGDIHLAIRGVVGQNGPLAKRGVIQVASWKAFPEIAPGCSGRQEFAEWISSPRHPLTARVIVNRVWYWMMGQGLVRTVDNFGSTGEPPTDPELLDHLANVFIEDGWSIKKLVRHWRIACLPAQFRAAVGLDCRSTKSKVLASESKAAPGRGYSRFHLSDCRFTR